MADPDRGACEQEIDPANTVLHTPDLLLCIIRPLIDHIALPSLLSLSLVNKDFRHVLSSDPVWRELCRQRWRTKWGFYPRMSRALNDFRGWKNITQCRGGEAQYNCHNRRHSNSSVGGTFWRLRYFVEEQDSSRTTILAGELEALFFDFRYWIGQPSVQQERIVVRSGLLTCLSDEVRFLSRGGHAASEREDQDSGGNEEEQGDTDDIEWISTETWVSTETSASPSSQPHTTGSFATQQQQPQSLHQNSVSSTQGISSHLDEQQPSAHEPQPHRPRQFEHWYSARGHLLGHPSNESGIEWFLDEFTGVIQWGFHPNLWPRGHVRRMENWGWEIQNPNVILRALDPPKQEFTEDEFGFEQSDELANTKESVIDTPENVNVDTISHGNNPDDDSGSTNVYAQVKNYRLWKDLLDSLQRVQLRNLPPVNGFPVVAELPKIFLDKHMS